MPKYLLQTYNYIVITVSYIDNLFKWSNTFLQSVTNVKM